MQKKEKKCQASEKQQQSTLLGKFRGLSEEQKTTRTFKETILPRQGVPKAHLGPQAKYVDKDNYQFTTYLPMKGFDDEITYYFQEKLTEIYYPFELQNSHVGAFQLKLPQEITIDQIKKLNFVCYDIEQTYSLNAYVDFGINGDNPARHKGINIDELLNKQVFTDYATNLVIEKVDDLSVTQYHPISLLKHTQIHENGNVVVRVNIAFNWYKNALGETLIQVISEIKTEQDEYSDDILVGIVFGNHVSIELKD